LEDKQFKGKLIHGISWAFIQQIITYLTVFIFGVILARLISPEEFGLVGIVGIFLGILPLFVDGGFANALKQRRTCTDEDFSTVFYFNLAMSIFLYLILFLSAKYIANFFNNEKLILITQVLGVNLILSSLASIQNVILSRRLDFKLIAKATVIAQIVSGIIAVTGAYFGLGIWALVLRTIIQSLLITVLLFTFNEWKPKFIFNLNILIELFPYGSKLFLGRLISVLFKNAFIFVIGKFYSPTQLGYYTRANNFSQLPSQNLTMIVQKVAFPAFSQIQDDKIKMLAVNRKMMKLLMFISSVLMIGLAASSEAFVISLIGEKWRPSIIYLQILSFALLLYPAHSININILNVLGRSDLSLKLVVIKNILMIPVIYAGIEFGIIWMLLGMVIYSIAVFFINGIWANKLINYSVIKQLSDIIPSLIIALIVGIIIFYTPLIFKISDNSLITLFLQVSLGFLLTIFIGEIVKYKPYMELKEILIIYIFKPVRNKIFSKKNEY